PAKVTARAMLEIIAFRVSPRDIAARVGLCRTVRSAHIPASQPMNAAAAMYFFPYTRTTTHPPAIMKGTAIIAETREIICEQAKYRLANCSREFCARDNTGKNKELVTFPTSIAGPMVIAKATEYTPKSA